MPHRPFLKTEDIQNFKQRLVGSITEPGGEIYDKQRTPWLQVVDQHPAVIVNAANTQDIVETVRFAREKDADLAVQNTGHGVALPCNGGVLLRLSEMREIQVNAADRTATAEPGVDAGELLKQTEPHGLAYPSGQVPGVGVTGYTLGGGVGWLVRKLGAASRALESATVVLADGSVVTASASENPDLFWALRGGGGNFGIVASLTVKLTPMNKVFGGMAYYRMKDAPDVLRFYRDWTANLSNDTSATFRLMKLPPKPNYLLHLLTEACAIGVCHADEGTASKLHDELKQFKTPVLDQLDVRAYSDMGQFDEASDLDGSATYGQAESLRDLSEEVVENIVNVAGMHIPPIMMFEIQQLGGALSQEKADDIAYTAPDAPFFFHTVAPAIKNSLSELAVATKEAFDSLGPIFTGHVPYNFLRGDQQDRVRDAFGPDKYTQLQSLKKKFDPSNLFRLNLNVPPAE